jgi:transcriptional regulator with XRE-family HTH domain
MGDYLGLGGFMRSPHGLLIPSQPVGEVAAELRLNREISQGQVELYTRINQSRLSRFEQGKDGILIERLFALADFYGEPIYWAGRRIVWKREQA